MRAAFHCSLFRSPGVVVFRRSYRGTLTCRSPIPAAFHTDSRHLVPIYLVCLPPPPSSLGYRLAALQLCCPTGCLSSHAALPAKPDRSRASVRPTRPPSASPGGILLQSGVTSNTKSADCSLLQEKPERRIDAKTNYYQYEQYTLNMDLRNGGIGFRHRPGT